MFAYSCSSEHIFYIGATPREYVFACEQTGFGRRRNPPLIEKSFSFGGWLACQANQSDFESENPYVDVPKSGSEFVRIDWSRCAEPQPDQHDSVACWDLVTTTTTPVRSRPHRRRLPGGDPTIFDGAVAVRYIADVVPGAPRNAHGPLEHPNLALAAEYLRRWPEAYLQFRTLMDSIHPMIDTQIPLSAYGRARGSNSHSDEDRFGTMYGTVHDPVGLSEAMVHEMAHNKLRGLGVYVERAFRIVTNPPDQLFESPIRKDRPRPMSAVLHAQYSFIYVTQLDLKCLAEETDPVVADAWLSMLALNVPRMELGFEEIRRSIALDATGRLFIDGFFAWSERVISEGTRLLDRHGVPCVPPVRTDMAQARPTGMEHTPTVQ